ncbi:MAG: signal peptidase I [Bacteroidia bacterium]
MENMLDEATQSRLLKPRKAGVAFLLSLLVPGLGQVYNGRLKKGATLLGLILLTIFLFGLMRWAIYFEGFVALISIILAVRIYIIIDAVREAKRQKEYYLKPYNTWYYHAAIAVILMLISWGLNFQNILGIKIFETPTSSSMPTIQVGDWFVADIRAYKNENPTYGDIVIFEGPESSIYTFRVVALPGDEIEIIDNIVSINGKLCHNQHIRDTTCFDFPVSEYTEELPNNCIYSIYKTLNIDKIRDYFSKANVPMTQVPENSYFVLGDHRDNAQDSRYLGFINKEKIFGKVRYTVWGKTANRMNINFCN